MKFSRLFAAIALLALPALAAGPNEILWRDGDVASRDLFYGVGGKDHEPKGPFTFVKEDLDASNPKFLVTDSDNVKWKVKLGAEAKPETAASRFVWAAGYSANEDYFIPSIKVLNLPPKLKRGQNLVQPGGIFFYARLKREDKRDGKKLGIWKWRENPFAGTREFNGLRVLMAVINNWDLKDDNNAIFQIGEDKVYTVSDLGASFGTTGMRVSHEGSKGNLHAYESSRMVSKAGSTTVDFNAPTRPAMIVVFNPHEFISRVNLGWIGKDIPIEDVRWIAQVLAKLTPAQIRDAFRAAGYDQTDIDGFAGVVERRIAELKEL